MASGSTTLFPFQKGHLFKRWFFIFLNSCPESKINDTHIVQAHLDMIGYDWMIWGKSFKPTPNFLAPKTFTPNTKTKTLRDFTSFRGHFVKKDTKVWPQKNNNPNHA